MRFILFSAVLLLTVPLRSDSMGSPSEINFGHDLGGPFITAKELEAWAESRNLDLVPDAPLKNIQDYEAVSVPVTGLEFTLSVPYRGRNYLYLDMVTFRERENPADIRLQWMDIFVNGRMMKTVYLGRGAYPENPLRITIDRENAPDGKTVVFLRPSPGDSSFALWDAFTSRYTDGNN